MKTNHHEDLPDGRLKQAERWLDRHELVLLRMGFLAMFCVSVVAGYLSWTTNQETDDLARSNRENFQQYTKESKDRRSQSCRGDEQEHLDNVNQLKQTYKILSDPKLRAEFDPGIIQFAIVNLPVLERKARVDQAPEFCDEPGFGLPEPDPVVPKKRDFSYLLSDTSPP